MLARAFDVYVGGRLHDRKPQTYSKAPSANAFGRFSFARLAVDSRPWPRRRGRARADTRPVPGLSDGESLTYSVRWGFIPSVGQDQDRAGNRRNGSRCRPQGHDEHLHLGDRPAACSLRRARRIGLPGTQRSAPLGQRMELLPEQAGKSSTSSTTTGSDAPRSPTRSSPDKITIGQDARRAIPPT